MGKQFFGVLALTLTALIWGGGFVAQSVGMDYLEPASFMAARFFLGGASMMPVVFVRSLFNRRGGVPEKKSAWPLRAGFICGAPLFLCGLLQQTGMVYTSVGKAGFITALYIIIVPLMGLFLGKRTGLYTWLCAFAALWGMYLLCVTGSSALNKGDIYVFVCAFFSAGHILVIDHFTRGADAVKLSAVQCFVCCALCLPFIFLSERPSWGALWNGRRAILYAGVMASAVAFTLQIVAQKFVKPAIASLIMSLESVFAALMGWLALGQTLTLRETAGCLVIFAAIIAAQAPDMFSRKKTSEAI